MAGYEDDAGTRFLGAMDSRVSPLRLPSSGTDLVGALVRGHQEYMQALPSSEHAVSLAQACDMQKNAQDIHGNGDQTMLLPETPDWDQLNTGATRVSPAELARMMNNPSEILRKVWASGADFGPSNLSSFRWACYVGHAEIVEQGLALIEGNAALLLDVLERRETQLRFSALMTAVAGARFLPGSKVFRPGIISPALIAASDHVKVVELLLKAGARVDAKDVAGFTLLHHCATSMATPRSLEIALRLSAQAYGWMGYQGADANSCNRLGDLSLFESTMHNLENHIAVLLEANADPFRVSGGEIKYKKPHSWYKSCWKVGTSPFSLAAMRPEQKETFLLNGKKGECVSLDTTTGRYAVRLEGEGGQGAPIAVKGKNLAHADTLGGKRVVLYGLNNTSMNGKVGVCKHFDSERERWLVELEGAEEGSAPLGVKRQNLKAVKNGSCDFCGKDPEGGVHQLKCSGCLRAGYCDEECQKKHWKVHRAVCKVSTAQEGVAVISPWTPPEAVVWGPGGGTERSERNTPNSNRRIVKVQVPLGTMSRPDTTSDDRQMKCYSKHLEIDFWIDKRTHPVDYIKIQDAILANGVGSGSGGQGMKAYFHGVIDQEGRLVLDYGAMLPPQPW